MKYFKFKQIDDRTGISLGVIDTDEVGPTPPWEQIPGLKIDVYGSREGWWAGTGDDTAVSNTENCIVELNKQEYYNFCNEWKNEVATSRLNSIDSEAEMAINFIVQEDNIDRSTATAIINSIKDTIISRINNFSIDPDAPENFSEEFERVEILCPNLPKSIKQRFGYDFLAPYYGTDILERYYAQLLNNN